MISTHWSLRRADRAARKKKVLAISSGGGMIAVQVTVNVVSAVVPADTVTVRGFSPPTVQFAATSSSSTS